MGHLPHFINDLALILIMAGIVTILFKWLKQPVVLGYIVAGFLAGPHFGFLPSISDIENISVWAEIGVIFLLFALGLEFSFKKLMSVGKTASIATIINLGSMVVIGYIIGRLFDWSVMNSIFLGGMLSMSSTTIIIKAFNDMGLQKQKFAHIVFGMLIVEDLAAILMMVVLSTFAVSKHFEGAELMDSMFKLLFFMLIWFTVGIYLIPTLLKRFQRFLNNETLLIVVIGLCLGMVLFATSVGFSSALGAFIMGSILAETVELKRIEHLIDPVKSLFGAVFFVSVGMMLNPTIIADHAVEIIILTVVVLVGRIIFATLGVVASGQGLKVAVQSGFSLAQIGEFSFIIATLGVSLHVIDEFLYPVIVAVSIITTFTTPYCIKLAVPFYNNMVERFVPKKLEWLIKGYGSSGYETTINRQSDWNTLLKNILRLIFIYSSISLSIIFLSIRFFRPFVMGEMPTIWGRLIVAVITILAISPFMRALIVRKNKSPEFKRLWADNRLNRTGLVALIFFKVVICIALVLSVLLPLFPEATFPLYVISVGVIAAVIYSQAVKRQSRRIEKRFLDNLNRKEILEENAAPFNKKLKNDLLNKDIHVEEIEVSQISPSVGKTLRELNFKQMAGVNVVSIIRGPKKINIPDGSEVLYPFDKIVVVGSDEEIQKCLKRVEMIKSETFEEATHHVIMAQFVIENKSGLAGKTIKELNTREIAECMILGIDRDGVSITDFGPDFKLKNGDVLWITGEKDRVNAFGEAYDL